MAPTQKIRPAFHSRRSRQLSLAPSRTIRARATFRIYAKTTAALVKEACRHAPMKIHKPGFL